MPGIAFYNICPLHQRRHNIRIMLDSQTIGFGIDNSLGSGHILRGELILCIGDEIIATSGTITAVQRRTDFIIGFLYQSFHYIFIIHNTIPPSIIMNRHAMLNAACHMAGKYPVKCSYYIIEADKIQ